MARGTENFNSGLPSLEKLMGFGTPGSGLIKASAKTGSISGRTPRITKPPKVKAPKLPKLPAKVTN